MEQINRLFGLDLPFGVASFWLLVDRRFSKVLSDSTSAALMASRFKRPVKRENSSLNWSCHYVSQRKLNANYKIALVLNTFIIFCQLTMMRAATFP